MSDDTTYTGFNDLEASDDSVMRTCTQVVSCVVGSDVVERRRQSLRARLERERFERQAAQENFFVSTLRNLLRIR